MRPVWRIELLGTLKARRDDQVVTRFRTRRVASLLAYLAYFRHRVHSRDEISTMLWPEAEEAVARRNLRQALSSLRHILEPAPLPSGSIILSIHDGIQLNEELVMTDVAEFEGFIELSRHTDRPDRAIGLLTQAEQEYRGDLLPGFLDDWIWPERIRLEDHYLSVLKKLSDSENPDGAIAHLRTAVTREPFNEDWHVKLIHRYLEIGRPEKALDQYSELERAMAESFGQRPSAESRRLAVEIGQILKSQGQDTPQSPQISSISRTTEPTAKLPIFANRFFGRLEQVEKICAELVTGSRLISILGPAGVGKTRLSVQCAYSLIDKHPWNVWFVPLADRFDSAEIYGAIIASMDPQHGVSSTEIDRISELTEGRPTLLVLDNLEQIAESAGVFIATLLDQVPQLSCLASSRQPLHVAYEKVFPIHPLPLPTSDQKSPAELALIPSIQLFVDRCQSIQPDLQLNERNAESIAVLCLRLEGLPLALEIAAGLSNSFSPAQMVNHLPLRQTELTSRRRDYPSRHRSLRAAIDWSFDLLPSDLQSLFRQLCVFRGGFTVDSVTAICSVGDDHLQTYETCFNALQSLQERSLVVRQPTEEPHEPRFALLVAFREYAEERISSDDLLALSERHAEYFAQKAPPQKPFASVEEQTYQHLSIEIEVDNLTSAIEFSLETGNIDRCVRLLGILALRWLVRGPTTVERRLIRQVAGCQELGTLSAQLRVQMQRMLGTTFIRTGEYEAAYQACAQAVAIGREDGDPQLLATCYSGLSICAGYLGRLEETLELNKRVLALAGTENLTLAERSHLGIGSVYWNMGRLSEASASFDKARAVSIKLRGGEPDVLVVINQARVALDLGRRDEALRLAHEAIRISRRLRDDFSLAVALTVVSRYHQLGKNFEAAIATNLEALEKCKRGDFLFWILQCMRNQSLIWTDMGKYQDAATLLAATLETGDSERSIDMSDERKAIETIKASVSAEQFESAWARGLAMDRREAIRFVSSANSAQ